MINNGFTLIEILVALVLAVVIGLILWGLLKSGIFAADRGEVSAQVRENARIALDRIQTELREATPVPVGTIEPLPAVIFPGPGGEFVNSEASAVGCSEITGSTLAGGCVADGNSLLDPHAAVPNPLGAGPPGFLIFSELIQQNAGAVISIPEDNGYTLNPENYLWVLYQVAPSPPGAGTAQVLRYTFHVSSGGDLEGVTRVPGGWERDDAYFGDLENSIEKPGNGLPVLTLTPPKKGFADLAWIMVSHGAASFQAARATGAVFDPQRFATTVIVSQLSFGNRQVPGLPPLMTTASSETRIEAGGP